MCRCADAHALISRLVCLRCKIPSHLLPTFCDRNLHASTVIPAEKNVYNRTFCRLAKDIADTVLSRKLKRVITLLSQREKSIASVMDMGIAEDQAKQYTTWKLKARFEAHFHDRLSFLERPGLTDLLCSSTVTCTQESINPTGRR